MNYKSKTILASAGLAYLLLMGSCTERHDNPDVGPDAPIRENVIVKNGTQSRISSTLYEFRANRLCVYVSSDEISSVDDLSAHSYCMVALIPVLLGEEFDILQEKSTFAIASYDSSAQDYDLYAAPGDNEGVSGGHCRVVLDEEKGYLVVDYKVECEDGRELAVYDSLACSFTLPDVAGNYIMCYDAKKPVNAAFYDDTQDGMLGIWLTPSAIDWFEVGHVGYNDINDAVSYLSVYVPENKLPESLQDIKTYDEDFVVAYMNREKDINNPLVLRITKDNADQAEGYISVSRAEGENSFNVIVDLTVEGEHVAANFSGRCKSVEDKPDIVYDNSVTFAGETFSIGSVIVDRLSKQDSGEVDVWICHAEGVQDIGTMGQSSPVELASYPTRWIGDAENEYYAGFSANKSMSVSYDGHTWNYASGAIGTAMLKDMGEDVYYVRFWNNADISFEWMGKVTVLK